MAENTLEDKCIYPISHQKNDGSFVNEEAGQIYDL